MKSVYLAVDTAFSRGMIIVFSDSDLLFSYSLDEKMAHGKDITKALQKAVQFCDDNHLHLKAAFSGLGPGSFVGIRIGLATLLGFSFGKNLPLQGFCSMDALACSIEDKPQNFTLFMKASGDTGYWQTVTNRLPSLIQVASTKEVLAHVEEESELYTDYIEAFAHSDDRLRVHTLRGPTALGVMRAANKLIICAELRDDSDVIKPNYIKPPSISLRKKTTPHFLAL